MTITDIDFVPQPSAYACVQFLEILRTCYGDDVRKDYIFFQASSSLSEITFEHYGSSHTNFSICRYWELDLHHTALKSSDDIRSVSGTTPESPHKFDSGYNTEYIQIFLVF